ncbi:MAG: SPOR domain-containing protein, partial [Rhodospirillales bacterium]|nr:SPOR domain-containing protein [Rhodospirillales bacterium]
REELATARREREELTLALTKALEGEQAAEASTAKAAALTQKLAATQEEIETLSTTIVREMGILVDSLNRNVAALGLKKQALEEELAMVSSERDLRSENLTAGDKRDADPAEGKLTEGAGVATEAAKPEATQPRVEIKSASMGTTTSPQEAADDKAAKPSGSAATPPKRAATRPKTPVASKQVATSRDQAEHIVELQSAKAAAGDYSVHLASYKSVERARTGWTTLQGDFPALLGDKTLAMQRIDLGERGIFHRVLAAPFDSRAQAQTFCAELKAKKQYCLVMKR